MSDCKRIKKLISRYIENDIAHPESVRIAKHIEKCESCKADYFAYKNIIAICNNLEEVDLPDGFHEKLHNRLVAETEELNKAIQRSAFAFDNKIFGVASCIAVIVLMFVAFAGVNINQWYSLLVSDPYGAGFVDERFEDDANMKVIADTETQESLSIGDNTEDAFSMAGAFIAPESDNSVSSTERNLDTIEDTCNDNRMMTFSFPITKQNVAMRESKKYIDLTISIADTYECLERIKDIVITEGGNIGQIDSVAGEKEIGADSKLEIAAKFLEINGNTVIVEIPIDKYESLINSINEAFPDCVVESESVEELFKFESNNVNIRITVLKK